MDSSNYLPQYRDDLKFLVDKAYSEHTFWTLEVRAHQFEYMKTILWVSSLLLAAECALILKFSSTTPFTIGKYTLTPTIYFSHLVGISVVCLFASFAIALHVLTQRTPYYYPYHADFSKHKKHAQKDQEDPSQFLFYEKQLEYLSKSVNNSRELSSKNALLTRRVAYALVGAIISLILALFSGISKTI